MGHITESRWDHKNKRKTLENNDFSRVFLWYNIGVQKL